jgi:hypothetical protein
LAGAFLAAGFLVVAMCRFFLCWGVVFGEPGSVLSIGSQIAVKVPTLTDSTHEVPKCVQFS